MRRITPKTVTESPTDSPDGEKKTQKIDEDTALADLAEISLTDFRVPHPAKSKSRSEFIETEIFKRATFHEMSQLIEQTPTNTRIYFFKKNDPGSPLSELEAAYAEFYRFLAPDYIPATYAIYDPTTTKYIGVISEKIPDFKSTVEQPLTEDHLNTDFMAEKKLSIEELDTFSRELTLLKKASAEIEKRARKINDLETLHNTISKKIESNPLSLSKLEIETHRKEAKANLCEKIQLIDARNDLAQNIHLFYERIAPKVTPRELEKYRIIKGTAIALTASYIHEEDDTHRNNMTIDGWRIDYDMSGCPISFPYKIAALRKLLTLSKIAEEKVLAWREPTADTFKVTAKDLHNFPYLVDAQPSYWPTKPNGLLSDSFNSALKAMSIFSVSTNPYPPEVNLLYQKIGTNPIFRYHYFKILAKYIMGNEQIYKDLTLMHIREDTNYEKEAKLLYGKVIEHQVERIAEFRNLLVKMPEFGAFFKTHHERIVTELLEDITTAGLKVSKTIIDKTCTSLLETIEATLNECKSIPKSGPGLTLALPVIIPPEVKVTPPTPGEALEKIKTTLKSSMQAYLNPGLLYIGIFDTRTHKPLATELSDYCDELKSNPSAPEIDIATIIELRKKIDKELSATKVVLPNPVPVKVITPGNAMHTHLVCVQKLIDEFKFNHPTTPSPVTH